MVLDPAVAQSLKKTCPELNKLPKDWTFRFTNDNQRRLYFVKGNETTYNHPSLGALPQPWILKLQTNDKGKLTAMYYNPDTRKQTMEDPRYMPATLLRQGSNVPRELQIAATMMKNKASLDLKHMKRAPIEYKRNIRHLYTEVHAIDPGDGSIGGMNGGVFVVTMKGVPNRLYIEKRFKSDDVEFNKKEIEMMHRLRHPALANFVAGFILEHTTPMAASVYIEFCDLGSMEDLIKAYRTRKSRDDSIMVPEGFVWHAFIGLADALAYLRDGVSHLAKKDTTSDPNWVPLLHRDIKPDNVLLRSRSTQHSTKYHYCVLSDFGLACEDRELSDPLVDYYQKSGSKLGTSLYFAPELCYDPYPQPENTPKGKTQRSYFPPGQKHSRYSDVWALGATIFNLCDLKQFSHMNMDGLRKVPGMAWARWTGGTASHIVELTTSSYYTKQLRQAVQYATMFDATRRASPTRLIDTLQQMVRQTKFGEQGADHEPLPEWSTKRHDYLRKAEKKAEMANDW